MKNARITYRGYTIHSLNEIQSALQSRRTKVRRAGNFLICLGVVSGLFGAILFGQALIG